MGYLLFIFYFAICTWLAGRFSFFKKSGIPTAHLRLYFAAKVAAAVFYGWYYQQAGGGDTWAFHQWGLDEWSKLSNEPFLFFTDLFQSGYQHYGGFFGVQHSWWNDLDANAMAKLLALFNTLTGGGYFANAALYNLLTFAGPVLIFKTAKAALPGAGAWVYYIPLLLPSVLFWCSGIHKEGLLLLALGLVVWAFYRILTAGFSIKRLAGFAAGLLLLLLLRNFLLLPLFVALPAWAFAERTRASAMVVFTGTAVLSGVLFFGLRFIHPSLNLPKIVVERQAAFSALGGKSAVAAAPLKPTITSFVQNAPAATILAFSKPWPADAHNVYAGIAAAEVIFILLFFIPGFVLLLRQWQHTPYFLFCALFSILLLLIVGYTVPIIGALVRYRCLALPWLLLPAVFMVEVFLKRTRALSTRQSTTN